MAEDKKVIGWFTVSGKHIPVYEGEKKSDAFKRTFKDGRKTVAYSREDNKKLQPTTKKSIDHYDKLNREKTAASSEAYQHWQHVHSDYNATTGDEVRAFSEYEDARLASTRAYQKYIKEASKRTIESVKVKKKSVAEQNEDAKAKQIAQNAEQANKAKQGTMSAREIAKARDEKFVNKVVDDIVNDDSNSTFSMGDIDAIVMGYADQHKGVDEDKLIETIRQKVDAKLAKQKAKAAKPKKVETPPMRTGQFWNEKSIDQAIAYLKNHKDLRDKVLNGISGSDRNSVARVLRDGFAEDFYRYDSAVADQFLWAYEREVAKLK